MMPRTPSKQPIKPKRFQSDDSPIIIADSTGLDGHKPISVKHKGIGKHPDHVKDKGYLASRLEVCSVGKTGLLNQYPWYVRFLFKGAEVLKVSSKNGKRITFTPPLKRRSDDEGAIDAEFDQVSLEMAGTTVYLLPAPSADPLTAVIHYCPNGKDCTSPCPQAPAPTSQKPPA